jgi:hypothetical protein
MAYTDTRNSVISNQVFSAATKLLAFSVSSPGAYGALAANLGFDLVEFGDPFQCGTLGAALGRAGQVTPRGFAELDEVLAWTERTEECWAIAALIRLNGELLLLQTAPAAAAAENHFRQALDWARRQGTLSGELRFGRSLAGLRSRRRTLS